MIRRTMLALVAVFLLCSQTMAAEKFVVATDCTWPPMEMLDANKQPEGFDVDFIKAVAKAAGFEVDVRNIAWDGIFGGVATGQYDIVASATTITDERKKQFDFSDPYYEVAQAVVLPTGKKVRFLLTADDVIASADVRLRGRGAKAPRALTARSNALNMVILRQALAWPCRPNRRCGAVSVWWGQSSSTMERSASLAVALLAVAASIPQAGIVTCRSWSLLR